MFTLQEKARNVKNGKLLIRKENLSNDSVIVMHSDKSIKSSECLETPMSEWDKFLPGKETLSVMMGKQDQNLVDSDNLLSEQENLSVVLENGGGPKVLSDNCIDGSQGQLLVDSDNLFLEQENLSVVLGNGNSSKVTSDCIDSSKQVQLFVDSDNLLYEQENLSVVLENGDGSEISSDNCVDTLKQGRLLVDSDNLLSGQENLSVILKNVNEVSNKENLCPQPKRTVLERNNRNSDPNYHRWKGFIQNCDQVEESGVPNFKGCKIPVNTHFNLDEWERLLVNYEDKEVVQFLRYGFPISFEGNIDLCEDLVIKNHAGAVSNPKFVEEYLNKEVERDHIMGPFHSKPFKKGVKVNPLNTVPKKESGDFRMISDLSYPKGRSVNDGIDKSKYLGEDIKLELASVDSFAKLVWSAGYGCLMFKKDLKSCYRQYKVDPGDVRKLGYIWDDKLYFDLAVPMGLRSGAYICQRVSNAIRYIYKNMGFASEVFFDDFGSAVKAMRAQEAYEALSLLFRVLGSIEAVAKSVAPHWLMIFLGILFNSVTMTMSIDKDRLVEIKEALSLWMEKESTCKKEVEKLAGVLSFVSKCVRPSRVFLARVFNFMAEMPDDESVSVSEEFRKDILWWYRFMEEYNGVSLIPRPYYADVNEIIETDACMSGCGGVNFVTGEFFHCEFPKFIKELNLHINELELLTVMVAIKLWKDKMRGVRARVQCDNTAAVAAMNLARMHNKFTQQCMREITYWTALSEFDVWVVHIEGVSNVLADALSRKHLGQEFKDKAEAMIREKQLTWVKVRTDLFRFSAEWI